MMNGNKKSLAEFIRETREVLGFSVSGLAARSALSEEYISDIESGKELFLPSTLRQKLARGLKLNPAEIRVYEKKETIRFSADNREYASEIKQRIADGDTEDLRCPVCGSEMLFKRIKRFDIEDNPVTDYKAFCKKCPFQIT